MNVIGVVGQVGSGKDEVAKYVVKNYNFQQIALADPIKRFGQVVFGFSEEALWGPSDRRNAPHPRLSRCEIRSSGVKFGPNTSKRSLSKVCDDGWYQAAVNLQEFSRNWITEDLGITTEKVVDECVNRLFFWFSSLGHQHPNLSARVMLQSLGTEWGREQIDQDIWVDVMLENTESILQNDEYAYDRRVGVYEVNKKDTSPKHIRPNGVVVSDVRFKNELSRIKEEEGKLIKILRPDTDKDAYTVGIENHASETEQKKFIVEDFDAVVNNDKTLNYLKNSVDIVMEGFGFFK